MKLAELSVWVNFVVRAYKFILFHGLIGGKKKLAELLCRCARQRSPL